MYNGYAYTHTLCTLLSVIISSVPGWNENVIFSMTHVHIVHVDSTRKFAGTHMSLTCHSHVTHSCPKVPHVNLYTSLWSSKVQVVQRLETCCLT